MRSPACIACRGRKSRCKVDASSPTVCLMCRSHGTDCQFAPPNRRSRRPRTSPGAPNANSSQAGSVQDSYGLRFRGSGGSTKQGVRPVSTPLPSVCVIHEEHATELIQVSSSSSHRLLGPLVDSDTRVLSDLVEGGFGGRRIGRTIWTNNPSGLSAPVTFSETRRRPVGLDHHRSSAQAKLEIIEHLLTPHLPRLTKLFFDKVNVCLPLLDKDLLISQIQGSGLRKSVSPALLSCIYAHVLAYWASDTTLASQRRPDQRFIWNLANEALYEELRMGPDLYTLVAVLLNIGGRPTTLVFNNAGQLGFAISVAFTLGLNRDPSHWDIPEKEKTFRIKVWRGLVIHDRWSSLAYGIPPRIQLGHTDISTTGLAQETESNAEALFELSSILYEYLDHLHQIPASERAGSKPSNRLQVWAESVEGATRRIIHRGTDLSLPGASNLRLCYLYIQFLDCRIRLESSRGSVEEDLDESFVGCYLSTRRAAKDIVLLLSELGPQQLQDFWLPELAFCLSTVMSFLMRSALETNDSIAGLPKNSSLEIVEDMMRLLKSHKRSGDWDVGDLCLSQYSDALDRIQGLHLDADVDQVNLEMLEAIFSDPSFQDNLLIPGV